MIAVLVPYLLQPGQVDHTPDPVRTYKDIHLPDDFYLQLSDDPVAPTNRELPGKDFLYNAGSTSRPAEFHNWSGGVFVLLDKGEKGSLEVCRRQVRVAYTIKVRDTSAGSQLCVGTPDGFVGLVTLLRFSGSDSSGHYVDVSLTVGGPEGLRVSGGLLKRRARVGKPNQTCRAPGSGHVVAGWVRVAVHVHPYVHVHEPGALRPKEVGVLADTAGPVTPAPA